MRLILSGLILLLAAQAEKPEPVARVRLIATIVGAGLTKVNERQMNIAYVQLTDKVPLVVTTSSDALKLFQDSNAQRIAVMKKKTDAMLELFKTKKGKELIEALDKHKEAFKKHEADVGLIVIEGALTPGDPVRMTGTVRALDRGKRDKDLLTGNAAVEGTAVAGTFAVGKDAKTTLAIRNAKGLILVTGKLPTDKPPQGTIRVLGTLRPLGKDSMVLEASHIESVK